MSTIYAVEVDMGRTRRVEQFSCLEDASGFVDGLAGRHVPLVRHRGTGSWSAKWGDWVIDIFPLLDN